MENPATISTTPGDPTYLWLGEPRQRGTFGIVTLCITTLTICVWSTIHYNVPTKRLPLTRRIFTQVRWMLGALFVPEYLFYIAINELVNASILVKKTLEFHPQLAKRGMLTCMYDNVRGLVWPKGVSTQHQPSKT